MRHLSSEEWAWLGGLFEGEGCFRLSKGARDSVHGTAYASIGMTDKDTIERVFEITGVGNYYIEDKRPPRKPVHTWRVVQRDVVEWFINGILPWLGTRRASKAEELLESIRLRKMNRRGGR